MEKNREWLIFNAIHAWLYAYEGVNEELTPLYKELHTEWAKKYEQSLNPPVQKRGRPAKRQRKKATSSIEASKEKVETPKEQT